jgi:hypothetical protein
MKDWLEVLASLLGSLARVGFIIALFSLGVVFAESIGMKFPDIVSDWSSAALVLGLVLIAVEGFLQAFRGIVWWLGRLARRRSLNSQQRRSDAEAIQNLRTLDVEEFDLLFSLLSSGEKRFQVGALDAAPRLVQKEILIFIKEVAAYSWICELNPIIEKNRAGISEGMANGRSAPQIGQ